MEIRPLTEEHLSALFALEGRCFSCPWSENSFLGALRSPFTHGFGLFEEERLLGYAFLFALFEEGEVMNVAVAPEERGKGLSRILMDALFKKAKEEQVEILRRNGMNPVSWVIVKELTFSVIVKHRITGEFKVIDKQKG